MFINENDIKDMVSTSLRSVINEWNKWRYTGSGVFDNWENLNKLEIFIFDFFGLKLETDDNREITNWDEFIEKLGPALIYARAKEAFDAIMPELAQKWQQINWDDWKSEDAFNQWLCNNIGNDLFYEMEDEVQSYVEEPEKWKDVPSVKFVEEAKAELNRFIEMYFNFLIEYKTREYSSEMRALLRDLSRI